MKGYPVVIPLPPVEEAAVAPVETLDDVRQGLARAEYGCTSHHPNPKRRCPWCATVRRNLHAAIAQHREARP